MANSLHVTLFLLLSLLAAHKALASSHNHGLHLRSLEFSLFQHETTNKTGFVIVEGVTGPGITRTTTPFGTIFVYLNNLTTTISASSRLVGIAEGVSITSSFDGFRSISVAHITLEIHGYRGTVSVVGVVHNTKPAVLPVVGGTGDFLFVQGYVKSTLVDLEALNVMYKIDFHLYWPPYATNSPN
ncbi:uncharacterized protein [Elaeis guineensis]|uniref:Dirigent protein n=1 Tax=Elaeis guineensis var. tenera TaxID=51953 RepID=A0A6I9RZX0_ELAGV|nr:dirigent protein 7 [Elaeis guineensis]